MNFGPASPEDLRAAQVLSGAAMASWLVVGVVPGIQAYATRIRVVVLIVFLLGSAGIAIHALFR